MPRDVTVTFTDGTQHVYKNAPDNLSPQDVSQRASRDFGKQVKALDGGRGPQTSLADTILANVGTVAPEARRQQAKPRTVNDWIGLGQRAILEGAGSLGSITDALTGQGIASSITGAPTRGQVQEAGAKFIADKARFAAPRTNTERNVSAGIRGAVQAVPFAFGGEAAAIPQLIGGAVGGVSSEVARQNGAPGWGQALAGLAGGVGGFSGANALSRFTRPKVLSPVMAAADRQGITLLPADAGGTGTRMATSVLRGATLGEIPIQQAAERSVKSAADAVSREAGMLGGSTDIAAAGQAAQRGARSFVASSEKVGGNLFERIPIRPDAPAATGNTVAALENVTRGLESNPVLSKIWTENPRLNATLEAIKGKTVEVPTGLLDEAGNPMTRATTEGGKLSWADMKDLRTTIGKIIGQPSLTSEGPERDALRALYGGLTQDMEATAAQNGPKALQAFRRANQYWRGRQSRIDGVLSYILGDAAPKSDEAAFRQVNTWAQDSSGNFKALGRALRSMPADEANTVRGTVLARLGKATPGKQSAEGDVFSPDSFVTNWNNLSPRSKSVLFPDAQHRKAVEDLALVMDNMKRAGAYTNTSKTGLAVGGLSVLTKALSDPISAAVLAGTEFGLGKLMASPRVARWIATSRVPATANQQIAMTNSMRALIAAEPQLEPQLVALGRGMGLTVRDAMNDNVGVRSAAGDRPEDQRK